MNFRVDSKDHQGRTTGKIQKDFRKVSGIFQKNSLKVLKELQESNQKKF